MSDVVRPKINRLTEWSAKLAEILNKLDPSKPRYSDAAHLGENLKEFKDRWDQVQLMRPDPGSVNSNKPLYNNEFDQYVDTNHFKNPEFNEWIRDTYSDNVSFKENTYPRSLLIFDTWDELPFLERFDQWMSGTFGELNGKHINKKIKSFASGSIEADIQRAEATIKDLKEKLAVLTDNGTKKITLKPSSREKGPGANFTEMMNITIKSIEERLPDLKEALDKFYAENKNTATKPQASLKPTSTKHRLTREEIRENQREWLTKLRKLKDSTDPEILSRIEEYKQRDYIVEGQYFKPVTDFLLPGDPTKSLKERLSSTYINSIENRTREHINSMILTMSHNGIIDQRSFDANKWYYDALQYIRLDKYSSDLANISNISDGKERKEAEQAFLNKLNTIKANLKESSNKYGDFHDPWKKWLNDRVTSIQSYYKGIFSTPTTPQSPPTTPQDDSNLDYDKAAEKILSNETPYLDLPLEQRNYMDAINELYKSKGTTRWDSASKVEFKRLIDEYISKYGPINPSPTTPQPTQTSSSLGSDWLNNINDYIKTNFGIGA